VSTNEWENIFYAFLFSLASQFEFALSRALCLLISTLQASAKLYISSSFFFCALINEPCPFVLPPVNYCRQVLNSYSCIRL
jgi:hypothetical protein